MVMPLRSTIPLSTAALALLAACADVSTVPAPRHVSTGAPAASIAATPTIVSGERQFGGASVEPAYDDQTGTLVYLLTPQGAPFPSKANAAHATAPLYLVEYPAGSTAGIVNCMGVPGNCPDHDAEVAGFAMGMQPTVYGAGVIGHDHLVAPPASGGDFNVAWEVVEVLFTSKAAANTHITTLADLQAAIGRGDAIPYDLGFAFNCSVVPATVYWRGTPVG